MTKSKRFAAFCAAAVFTSMLVPLTPAHAATNYVVQVGAQIGDNCDPQTGAGCYAESMRFLPGKLTVHKGDTLQFGGGFHTATMLPKNTDAQNWVDNNASNLSQPYFFLAANPDDTTHPAKGNPAAVFGNPTCGVPAAPCDYDGSSVVNSGVFVFGDPSGFSATVNANPGDYFWVICLVHPHMRMKVTVVDDNTAASDPTAVAAASAATVAADQETASSLNTRLNKPSSHRTADGKTVWDAYGGFDTHYVTLYNFYPKKLVIDKGDTVRWHFDNLVYETHTASIPQSVAAPIAGSDFSPSCDPDTDAGSAPNNPPELPNPPFCNDPTQLELLVSAQTVFPSGNGVYTGGTDFESSGVRGVLAQAPPGGGNAPFDVRFTKASTKKGFKYICMIHPFMVGKVVVK